MHPSFDGQTQRAFRSYEATIRSHVLSFMNSRTSLQYLDLHQKPKCILHLVYIVLCKHHLPSLPHHRFVRWLFSSKGGTRHDLTWPSFTNPYLVASTKEVDSGHVIIGRMINRALTILLLMTYWIHHHYRRYDQRERWSSHRIISGSILVRTASNKGESTGKCWFIKGLYIFCIMLSLKWWTYIR